MNKIIIFSLAFFVSLNVMAQEERMPFGEKSSYFINKTKVKSIQPYGFSKGVIYSEDFDSYTDVFTSKWDVKRSTDLTGDNLVDATSPFWFLCKPSSFNGNGANYIYSGEHSAAISYTAQDFTWLFGKDTIEIPDEDGYFLNFWMWYYNNTFYQYITYFHVMVYDVDNLLWDDLANWDQTSGSNQFLNKVALSLNDYKGKRIRLAFVYENKDGLGNQVAIDEISITNTTSPDLTINGLEYIYSEIPYFLVDTFKIPFNAIVKNIGSKLEDTATISVTTFQLSNFISEAEIVDTLDEGESRFVKTDSLLKLHSKGHYKFIYEVGADQDEVVDNNVDSTNFEVSDDIFATDFGIVGGMSLGQDQEFGNIYQVFKPCFIKGVQVGWPDFSSPNFATQEYELNIYELNPVDSTISNILYSETVSKDITQSDTVHTVTFNPIYCTPGNTYFVTIRQLESTSIGIGYDKVFNGSFWKFSNGKGGLEKLANPTIGNISLRLVMKEPDLEPKLTFSINDGTSPVVDLDIVIVGIDTLKTDVSGQASINLENGLYYYNIYPENFAPIRDTVRILYQNVTLDLTLEKLYKAKFLVTDELGNPIENAEIIVSDSLAVTNSVGEDSLTITPGLYFYTVTASGYFPYSDYLIIAEEDTLVEVELVTAQTYSVVFNIYDENSNPLESAKVTLGGYGSKYTNNQGQVTFVGVVPETFILYSVSKYGYEDWVNFIDVVDQNITEDLELVAIKYTVTFFVSNGTVGLSSAKVKLVSYPEVTTDAYGYALVEEVVPATNIDYTVTRNNFHVASGKVTIIDSDIRENIILIPLSVPETATNDIEIYPNPTFGKFRISGDNVKVVCLFDLTGKIIDRIETFIPDHEFDLSNKPAGIYFVKIESNDGVVVRRLIKK